MTERERPSGTWTALPAPNVEPKIRSALAFAFRAANP
jgi:hypothetical protein